MAESRNKKKSQLSSWSEQSRLEQLALPDPKKILEIFWHERIVNYNKDSVENFKKYLIENQKDKKIQINIETLFTDAICQRIKFDEFCKEILNLGTQYIHDMNGAEKLIPVPESKIQDLAHSLEENDVLNMKKFMEEQKMSASVTLRTDAGKLTSVVHPESKSQDVYSMHSVGKVFTGMLAITMIQNGIISEKDLNSPIQLHELALMQLPSEVQERLKHVTLHQVMTHRAGLGDYLDAYMKRIEEGLAPDIKQVEDFLQFVDPKIGESNYSNDGILLVGLALKHAYEKYVGHTCDYNDMLKEFILDPAGIKNFSAWPSKNSKVNPDDPVAPHIVGSPGGGYWTTADDLAKFGCWIYETCKNDPKLKKLIEKYGQEFYEPERELIFHGGAISSSSAYFSVSLKTGKDIAIMSDQPGTAFILHDKIEKNIVADKSLDVTDSEMADSVFAQRKKL